MSLNEIFTSPVFDGLLLNKSLVIFTVLLLTVRFLPDFARNLTILLSSVAVIEIITSPFYTFGFVATTGLIYYGLFWLQWHPRKSFWSHVIAVGLVVLYFFLLDLPMVSPAWVSPWIGPFVHRFGVAYGLFRMLSVTLDVGRGKPLPSDPLEFFVYAFFAPTFFQGPIERLDEFRKNLSSEMRPLLSWPETGSQFIRIAVAILKGWVATHYLELDWKTYFDYPQHLSYGTLVWGLYARAFGFYLFVSAANDLTIACCALAGYRISENYDYPYFRKNLAEFWRTWHMTLTRFTRDYLYIPLGGKKRHIYRNYAIVFLAIAMWHVTSWAFLIWGLWHGLGMCFLKMWQDFWKRVEAKDGGPLRNLQLWGRSHPRMVTMLSVLVTFHYVALGWLPFWGGHPQGLSMLLRILSGNHWTLFIW